MLKCTWQFCSLSLWWCFVFWPVVKGVQKTYSRAQPRMILSGFRIDSYCWWKTSQTTTGGFMIPGYPMNNGISTPGTPSTGEWNRRISGCLRPAQRFRCTARNEPHHGAQGRDGSSTLKKCKVSWSPWDDPGWWNLCPKNLPGSQVKNPAKYRIKPFYRRVQWFLGWLQTTGSPSLTGITGVYLRVRMVGVLVTWWPTAIIEDITCFFEPLILTSNLTWTSYLRCFQPQTPLARLQFNLGSSTGERQLLTGKPRKVQIFVLGIWYDQPGV